MLTSNLYSILDDGRWKIRFDHHMISNFSTCEQLFNYRHVPRLVQVAGSAEPQPKVLHLKGGFSWAATFGIWWAHVLEDFYNHVERSQKNNEQPPQKGDLIKYAIRWWMKDDMDRFALTAPTQYTKFAIGYIQVDLDGRPVKFPQGAALLASQYYDYTLALQDFVNWKVIATESAFGVLSDVIVAENDSVVVCYQGRPDLVVYDVQKNLVKPVDHKTTSDVNGDFVNNWKPNAQLLGYEVSVQELCKQLKIDTIVDKCIINGIARDIPSLKPKDGRVKSRFRRINVEHSASEIAEWRKQMLARAVRLRYCIENDEWIWKESACHNQYGYPCEYKELERRSPEDRLITIHHGYEYVDPWDVRGK
jgi:hypothetical protein